MHDINNLEKRGIPGVFIASNTFASAAQTQGEALGFHPQAVYVPHPIQDRTDEEIRTLADGAYEEVLRAILG